jgi:maltoporin
MASMLRSSLCITAVSVLLTYAPRPARADLPADRVDFAMYGRVGIAWTLSGQVISGRTMNLGDKKAIGGRFEEGDYLEPAVKAHILKGDDEDDTKVDMVMTFGMFARNGSFIDALASNTPEALGIEMFQAYIEGQNVFVPGLTFWAGARQYRGGDVHNADYFYFNDLSGQGAGVKYKGLDTAVLIQTAAAPDIFYNADLNGDGTFDVQRQRTIFVGQYTHPFGPRSTSVQGLGEFHVVPEASRGREGGIEGENPRDFGWVIGAKLHLDLDKGAFNDLSVRYGGGIANGAWGGTQTFYTFGEPGANGTYGTRAYGLEVVDHFLWNFGDTLSLNAYAILNRSVGGSGEPVDQRTNFAVGVRTTLYAHDRFHLLNEATFQGRKDGDEPGMEKDMGTALKVSVVPTIVPTGERSVWARPHLRLIYTAGFYNDAAVEQLMSPYLQAVGPTKTAHFLGTRAEWWF